MTKLQLSAGDRLAARRADFAEMLLAEGNPAAAAEMMAAALELAPDWVLGWYRAGEMFDRAGLVDEAERAWRRALKLDPVDHSGACLGLQLIGRSPQEPGMPSAFVETLFDQYASGFDAALVDRLGYCGPELLSRALAELGRPRFARAMDLGCGTGLMGERLRPICDLVEGVDISKAMLDEARRKGVYDALRKSDLRELELEASSFDLVAAADVLTYFGQLDALFAKVAEWLAPAGLFALTVERNPEAQPFRLLQSRRYAHSESYLTEALNAAGFDLAHLALSGMRYDGGSPVVGLIAVGQRRSGRGSPAPGA